MEFTSFEQFEKYIENAINKALIQTLETFNNQLQSLIQTEYYNQYEPEIYDRTYTLLKAHAYQMLSKTSGIVGMEDRDYYYQPSSGFGIRNIQNSLSSVIVASSQGYHGVQYDKQTGGRYWEEFMKFVYSEGLKILANNLKAQGLPIEYNGGNMIENGMEF